MDILPDLLIPDLKVVFCGMAVDPQSAKANAYHAAIGERFWKILYDVGLTPIHLCSRDYTHLLKYGIGLTDLIKDKSGYASTMFPTSQDIADLRSKIIRFKPYILAIIGKTPADWIFEFSFDYGLLIRKIPYTNKIVIPEFGGVKVYVMPPTSSQGMHYWDSSIWQQLSDDLKCIISPQTTTQL